jgi:hypothetical protein
VITVEDSCAAKREIIMYLTTPIPTLTLDISKFISEKYPSIQEIALKSYILIYTII